MKVQLYAIDFFSCSLGPFVSSDNYDTPKQMYPEWAFLTPYLPYDVRATEEEDVILY